MKGRPVSQVEVETELLGWVDHLEVLTNGGHSEMVDADFEGYDDLCDAAAGAEADWKIAEANGLIAQANRTEEGKRGEPEYLRKARVLALKADEYRAYKMTAAVKESRKEALVTTRARCDALRTVCANTRTQT